LLFPPDCKCDSRLQVDDRAQEPQPELALSHGGDALVHEAENAEALLALTDAHRRGVPLLLHEKHSCGLLSYSFP